MQEKRSSALVRKEVSEGTKIFDKNLITGSLGFTLFHVFSTGNGDWFPTPPTFLRRHTHSTITDALPSSLQGRLWDTGSARLCRYEKDGAWQSVCVHMHTHHTHAHTHRTESKRLCPLPSS